MCDCMMWLCEIIERKTCWSANLAWPLLKHLIRPACSGLPCSRSQFRSLTKLSDENHWRREDFADGLTFHSSAGRPVKLSSVLFWFITFPSLAQEKRVGKMLRLREQTADHVLVELVELTRSLHYAEYGPLTIMVSGRQSNTAINCLQL